MLTIKNRIKLSFLTDSINMKLFYADKRKLAVFYINSFLYICLTRYFICVSLYNNYIISGELLKEENNE